MTIERVRHFLEAQPFQPFTLHLADGREIAVHHREFMAAFPSGRTVVVIQTDETMNVVDLLLVTDIELKKRRKGSSGKRGRG